jgi:hypothetical protein
MESQLFCPHTEKKTPLFAGSKKPFKDGNLREKKLTRKYLFSLIKREAKPIRRLISNSVYPL